MFVPCTVLVGVKLRVALGDLFERKGLSADWGSSGFVFPPPNVKLGVEFASPNLKVGAVPAEVDDCRVEGPCSPGKTPPLPPPPYGTWSGII